MWGVGRFTHMEDFVARSGALGFDCVELNHQITEPLLDEILAIYRDGNLVVTSVHDPCPNASPRMELLPKVSDIDETARQAGVRSAKRTIDLAHRLRASFVVLHLGDVTELRGHAQRLRDHFHESLGASPEYRAELSTFKEDFAALQQPHLDAVARSLEDLLPYARERGIRLGLENRYYVNEIPNLWQADWLLQRFTDATAGYWHDVGHAESKRGLRGAPRLAGDNGKAHHRHSHSRCAARRHHRSPGCWSGERGSEAGARPPTGCGPARVRV